MKKIVILLIIGIMLFSCNNNTNESTKDSIINKIGEAKDEVKTEIESPMSDEKKKTPFFIINVSAFSTADSAYQKVLELRKEKYKADYLWLPDYKSLSNKQLYVAFIGYFFGKSEAYPILRKYKKENKNAYIVKVSHKDERVIMLNSFDIRKNGKKQKFLFTYATPTASEEYAENGGEDWGWFTNDVITEMQKTYDDIICESAYHSWLSKNEIKKLEQELKIDTTVFGYILIDGNRKHFIQHDMPEGVIDEANEFFKK